MENFYRHLKNYEYEQKSKIEYADYLAWRTGESVKSALESTAILSLMVDGKDAKKVLKNVKYQESPAFILIENEKNKQLAKNKRKDDIERIKLSILSDDDRINHNKKMQLLRK